MRLRVSFSKVQEMAHNGSSDSRAVYSVYDSNQNMVSLKDQNRLCAISTDMFSSNHKFTKLYTSIGSPVGSFKV